MVSMYFSMVILARRASWRDGGGSISASSSISLSPLFAAAFSHVLWNPSHWQLWRYPHPSLHPCWNLLLVDLTWSIQPLFVICGNNVSCLQIHLELCLVRCDTLFQIFQALLEDDDHGWRCLFTNFSDHFSLQSKSLHKKLYLTSQICPNSLKNFTQ